MADQKSLQINHFCCQNWLYLFDKDYKSFNPPKPASLEDFILYILVTLPAQGLYTLEDTNTARIFHHPRNNRTFDNIFRLCRTYVDKYVDKNIIEVYETLFKLISEGKIASFICTDIDKRIYYHLGEFYTDKTPRFLSVPIDEYRFDFSELLAKYPQITTDKTTIVDPVNGREYPRWSFPNHYGPGNNIKTFLI